MVVIFNVQKSDLLTLSLPTERVFQVNGSQKSLNLTVYQRYGFFSVLAATIRESGAKGVTCQ